MWLDARDQGPMGNILNLVLGLAGWDVCNAPYEVDHLGTRQKRYKQIARSVPWWVRIQGLSLRASGLAGLPTCAEALIPGWYICRVYCARDEGRWALHPPSHDTTPTTLLCLPCKEVIDVSSALQSLIQIEANANGSQAGNEEFEDSSCHELCALCSGISLVRE